MVLVAALLSGVLAFLPANAAVITWDVSFANEPLSPLGLRFGLGDPIESTLGAQVLFFDTTPLPGIPRGDVLALEIVPTVRVTGEFTVFGNSLANAARLLGGAQFAVEDSGKPVGDISFPNAPPQSASFAYDRFCNTTVIRPECDFVTAYDLFFFGTPLAIDLLSFQLSDGFRFRFDTQLRLDCALGELVCFAANTAQWSGGVQIRATIADDEPPLVAVSEPPPLALLLLGLVSIGIACRSRALIAH
jgi:hypothetical protein